MIAFKELICTVSSLHAILQALALSACTTLVSVEPKLTIETRNHVLKVLFYGGLIFPPYIVEFSL